MTEKTVILKKHGRIGRVILNRPEVLNAIDDRLPHDLADAVDAANQERDQGTYDWTRDEPVTPKREGS